MIRMMAQKQTDKSAPRKTEEEAAPCPKALETKERQDAVDKAEEIVDEIDEVLEDTSKPSMDEVMDEIDEVLEENAEEFVKNYVQRGGE